MEIKINNFPVKILKMESFPIALAKIQDAPQTLYYRGRLPDWKRSWIGMVGTRRASANAEEICKKLVHSLRGTDAVVVSGLAQGIDSFCHNAALQFGIPTVAVIAQGIEAKIQGSRKILAKQILEAGGAIISEYPEQKASLNFMFPKRNRIIASLSKSITLIESKIHGGGMITVEYAEKFKRKIFAVPGSILSENAQGPNSIIAKGLASPIWNSEDFADLCGAKRFSDTTPSDLTHTGISLSADTEKFFSENAGFTHSLDELCTRSALPISAVLAILTELEIVGLVHTKEGNTFHFSATE